MQKIKAELSKINSLIRSIDFSLSMAESHRAVHYTSLGESIPPFLDKAEEAATVAKNLQEEKIACSLAWLYAVESGVDLLCSQTHETPCTWLHKIVHNQTSTAVILLLNRLANATWKASRPFMGLDRISDPVFVCANLLAAEEIKKTFVYIKIVAGKLLLSLQEEKNSSFDVQMQVMRNLLHSQQYASEISAFIDLNFKHGLTSPANDFGKNDSTTTNRFDKEQKIAIGLADFYALECCVNYLVTIRTVLPSDVLTFISNETISKDDRNLFCRFGHATWQTVQPFRDLRRIEKETFVPFYFLNEADADKRWKQIKAAADKLLLEI